MRWLSHYRDKLRGWGTDSVSFAAPPPLSYSPRSRWNGLNHYMAHAVDPDPELYKLAMNRACSEVAVGLHEARHWHRLCYGGLIPLNRRTPAELGYAAAYEAFRYFLHHESLYKLLRQDYERQYEALVSLAIAEASHLWYEARPGASILGLQTAAATAAATAALLASQHRDITDLGRQRLYPDGTVMVYGDAYAADDDALLRPWNSREFNHNRPGRLPRRLGQGLGGLSSGSSTPYSPRLSRSEERDRRRLDGLPADKASESLPFGGAASPFLNSNMTFAPLNGSVAGSVPLGPLPPLPAANASTSPSEASPLGLPGGQTASTSPYGLVPGQPSFGLALAQPGYVGSQMIPAHFYGQAMPGYSQPSYAYSQPGMFYGQPMTSYDQPMPSNGGLPNLQAQTGYPSYGQQYPASQPSAVAPDPYTGSRHHLRGRRRHHYRPNSGYDSY